MRFAAILVAIIAVLAGTGAALAHASLIASEPAAGVVLAEPPARLILTFNEPVSPLTLRLVRSDGAVFDLKDIKASGATISIATPANLPRGTHLLSWRVISEDGHPVGGALTFSVGRPSVAPAQAPPDAGFAWRAATWLARLLFYLGLFVGAGGAFYCRWIAASPQASTIAALRFALLGGLLAAIASAGLQGVDVIGGSLADLLREQTWQSGVAGAYGLTLGIAAAAFLLALAAISARRLVARVCSAAALAAAGLALAASGHAAAASPQFLTRPAVFLHGTSVAFWVGALLPLAAAMRRGEGSTELLRFSRAIPIPLIVLVASGALIAVIQLQRLDALWTTAYGTVLFGKLIAVALLLLFAVVNRWHTPRAAAGDANAARRMVRSIWCEVAVVMVILGLVASWRFTPPPRSLFAAASQPVHVHIHADKAMADIEFDPVRVGGRTITLEVLDGEFRPLAAKEVELVLSKPDAGIEPLRLKATHVEGTSWKIDSVDAPFSGRWHVRVNILVSDFDKITIEDDADLR
jgi:copper transport protein